MALRSVDILLPEYVVPERIGGSFDGPSEAAKASPLLHRFHRRVGELFSGDDRAIGQGTTDFLDILFGLFGLVHKSFNACAIQHNHGILVLDGQPRSTFELAEIDLIACEG